MSAQGSGSAVAPRYDQLKRAMQAAAAEIESALDMVLPRPVGPEAVLFEAMRHAALGTSKRLRPFLALQCGRLFDIGAGPLKQVAVAIECIHVYSQVHGELLVKPSDGARPGRQSVRGKFDEAIAVLAGDALQALAFQLLVRQDTHADPFVRCELVSRLASAVGGRGMAGGRTMEITARDEGRTIEAVTRMQRMKTGALIAFACEAGGLMAKASPKAMHALNAFAHDLGLALQIADDLVATGDGHSATAGDRPEPVGKATFVEILGPERARDQADHLAAQAARHLDMFDERADLLRMVAEFAVAHNH